MRLADDPARRAEIGGDRLAQRRPASRVRRVEEPPSLAPAHACEQAAPLLEGEGVECRDAGGENLERRRAGCRCEAADELAARGKPRCGLRLGKRPPRRLAQELALERARYVGAGAMGTFDVAFRGEQLEGGNHGRARELEMARERAGRGELRSGLERAREDERLQGAIDLPRPASRRALVERQVVEERCRVAARRRAWARAPCHGGTMRRPRPGCRARAPRNPSPVKRARPVLGAFRAGARPGTAILGREIGLFAYILAGTVDPRRGDAMSECAAAARDILWAMARHERPEE